MNEGVVLENDSGSRRIRIAYGCVLLVLTAICGALVPSHGFMPGMCAVLFGVAGLAVIVGSMTNATGTGPCPGCGAILTDVPLEVEATACTNCGAFAIARGGRLFPTPEDNVASHAVYPVILEPGAQPDFRGMCVACGAPATASAQREMSKTVVGAPGVGRLVKDWSIAVPACAAHAAPDANGNIAGVTSFGGTLSIRSYRAWRAAMGR
jgi:hypothetical protein